MAENGPFGTPVLTPKIPPKRSLFCVLSQEMRRINLFLGAQKIGGFLGGGQRVYVEKVYVLFPPLKIVPNYFKKRFLGAIFKLPRWT